MSFLSHFPGVISLDYFHHHFSAEDHFGNLDPGCLYDFLAIYPKVVVTGVFYTRFGHFSILVWCEH